MTEEELKNLAPGDVVRHVHGANGYLVTANYGGRITAVRTIDISNAQEWVLAVKAHPEVLR